MSCEHAKAYFRDDDKVGWMYCPECKCCITMCEVMNKLIAFMRECGFDKAKEGERK